MALESLCLVNSLTESVIKAVLNIKEETPTSKWLQMGDESCKERRLPMSPELRAKLREIYNMYRSRSSKQGDTPLMLATENGLTNLVWGFIQCAEKTDSNFDTGEIGSFHVQEFLWHTNEDNETAFDIATRKGHVEVARLLLKSVRQAFLSSQRNHRTRKALLQLLNDPKHDEIIVFDIFEDEKASGLGSTSSSVTINTWPSVTINRQQELKLYCKGAETLVTPEFLEELGNGLLGSNESNNTVLHLVSKIGNMACVDYILGKHPSQIYSLNSNTETPAYVAAREGRADILGLMINFVRQKKENIESILTRRTDKHNALHIAIQNHHIEVVYLLIEEIPQLANHVNESNESALYLAAERGYFGIVRLILTKCSQIDLVVEGPNGKTALHAAAISDSAGCLKYLLNAKGHLLNVHDTRGWSPLHYAIHHNSSSAAKELLEANFSIGYQLLLEGGIHTPPIHIAASRGHCETLQVLMDMCPGCSEFVDNKGRNILHVAIENKKYKATEFIFRDESLTNLINQKDHKRDTPIHLLIDSDYDQLEMLIDSRVHINALDNGKLISSHHQKERLLKAITMNGIHDNKSAFSPKINESAQNEVECEVKEIPSGAKGRKADGRYMIVDNLVVVAALIATATFAAGFTVPGGFSSDEGPKQGTPLLLKKAAFKAFVVTNALAFSSSCSVLFLHISLLIYPNQFDEASPGQKEFISRKVMNMYVYTVVALIAMTIAFVTGVYVVLTPSHALAISVCVMSLALMEYIVQ